MTIQFLQEEIIYIIVSPFILSLMIYGLLALVTKQKWRRIHLMVQISALFYVAAVLILVEELFDQFILSYVLIAFLLFLAVHVTVQWKKDMHISLWKAILLLLRVIFLLFSLGLILLSLLYAIRFFA